MWPLKSRPCENSLADFCTSALLKGLKINLLYPKKANGRAFRSAEVQKSARELSDGLDTKPIKGNSGYVARSHIPLLERSFFPIKYELMVHIVAIHEFEHYVMNKI